MLTDFDLSYCQGSTTPSLLVLPPPETGAAASTGGSAQPPAAGSSSTSSGSEAAAAAGAGTSGRPAGGLASGQRVLLVAQPSGRANSFVGTEEYLAPEVITGGQPTPQAGLLISLPCCAAGLCAQKVRAASPRQPLCVEQQH